MLAKPRTIPELLRMVREKLGGVSQEQLAHRLGVTWSTISRWENGRGKPSPLARGKLVDVLGEVGLSDHVGILEQAR